MTAYNAALAALNVREIGKTKSAHGTVSAAIASYYKDNRFTSLASGTQMSRRAILERFRLTMETSGWPACRNSTSRPFWKQRNLSRLGTGWRRCGG